MTKLCPKKRPSIVKTVATKTLKASPRRGGRGPVTGQFLNRIILDAPVKLSARERAEVQAIARLMRV